MKRTHPVQSLIPKVSTQIYLFIALFLVLTSIILSSCNSGTKGRSRISSNSIHWLQFRGPNASGIAPINAKPPIHFNADTNLLWKTEILPGWSSPCTVNEKIFLTGYDEEASLFYTFAINRKDGTILWSDSVKADTLVELHPINGYANPTVLSDGKRIFAEFPEYGMVAYDLDGTKLWEFRHEAIAYFYGGSCSPILYDSTVVLIVNPRYDRRIYGLDPQSGDSIWCIRPASDQSWYGSNIGSTPLISEKLMILHYAQHIVAYDMPSREVKWWIRVPTNGVGSPVVEGDILYLNTWIQFGEKKLHHLNRSFEEYLAIYDENRNHKLEQNEIPDSIYGFQRPEILNETLSSRRLNESFMLGYFDQNEDLSYDSIEWAGMMDYVAPYMKPHGMLAMQVIGSGELSDSEILWKVTEDTPETPSPLIVDENIVFIKNGGIMTVINRSSGNVIHHGRIGAAGGYLASPMLAGNRIYTCSFNGIVSVISTDEFKVLAQNKLKEKIGASPVAVDDVLYIRTDEQLYAFREH